MSLTIDGQPVSVPEGTTILAACREIGVEIPTLCFLDTLHPVNACRICVVEVEGARVLVPACSRAVEDKMVVQTNSSAGEAQPQARARDARVVGRSVDDAACRRVDRGIRREAGALRTARAASPAGTRDASVAGHHAAPDPRYAATVAEPTKIDNDLYVRDYAKCILCYKCVEACGPDHQNTFAIAVAGRGFDAHISTEFAVPLPDSACVYCGNCIAVCPTGALMAKHGVRQARGGHVGRGAHHDDATRSVPIAASGARCGCTSTNGEIVKATSPFENSITQGNLCIKGRFGWRFVQTSRRQTPSTGGARGNGAD